MTNKEWLAQYYWAKKQSLRLQKRINDMCGNVAELKSNSNAEARRLISEQQIYLKLMRRIEYAIDSMKDQRYCLILKYKFIDNMKTDEIADELGYSISQIKRLMALAINAVDTSDSAELNKK